MNEAEGSHTHQAVERLAQSLTGSVTAEGFVVYALRAYKDTRAAYTTNLSSLRVSEFSIKALWVRRLRTAVLRFFEKWLAFF